MKQEVMIDGVVYTPKAELDDEWVMVRSRDAGVFAGRFRGRDGDVVTLADARRIWWWEGAATLSQLATEGTTKPTACKFPVAVPSIEVLGVCEVIPMTTVAVQSIASVEEWSE